MHTENRINADRTSEAIALSAAKDRSLSRLMGASLRDMGLRPRRLGHRIAGCSGAVTGLALNEDESLIYASTRTGTIKVVNRETWKCVDTFAGHRWWVSDVAYANGTIASAGADRTVRIWDTDGNCRETLTGHSEIATGVSFNLAGDLLASAGRDGHVCVWRKRKVGGWHLARRFEKQDGWILSLCFADEARIVSAGFDGVKLLDTRNGDILAHLSTPSSYPAVYSMQGPYDFIRAFRMIPLTVHCVGQLAVAGHSGGYIYWWDVSTGTRIRKSGAPGSVFAIRISPDGDLVADGTESDSVGVSRLSTKEGCLLRGHTDWPLDLAITRDGKVISGSMDSTIREWDVARKQQSAIYRGATRSVCDIDLRGTFLAVGGHDQAVSVYDLASGTRQCVHANLHHWVNGVALSPDGSRVAAGTLDGEAVLVDARSGKRLAGLCRGGSEVNTLAFSGDGSLLLAGFRSGLLSLFDAATGIRLRDYQLCTALVHHVQFLNGSREFLAACWDARTYRGTVADGRITGVYAPPDAQRGQEVEVAALSEDGAHLVTVAFDGMVRVYDARTAVMTATFRAHPGRTRSMALRGNILATGGLDACIRVWEWKRQRLLHTLTDCGDSITALHFDAAGERLVAGSRDGTVRFFSCNGKYELLATLYSLAGDDWLWETPDGWFHAQRPREQIEVVERDEDGSHVKRLAWDDARTRTYVATHNNYSSIKGATLGGVFQTQADCFRKLVEANRYAGRLARRLGSGDSVMDNKGATR
jgi:WD40 repeat protein